MIKPFYDCPNLNTFKTLKLSVDNTNTKYYLYGQSSQTIGTPDILWEQIVFIIQESIIYLRGKIFYNLDELISFLTLDEKVITNALINLNDKYKTCNRFIDSLKDNIVTNHNIMFDLIKNNEKLWSKILNDLNNKIGEDEHTYTAEDEQVINGDKNIGDVRNATGLLYLIRNLEHRIEAIELTNS